MSCTPTRPLLLPLLQARLVHSLGRRCSLLARHSHIMSAHDQSQVLHDAAPQQPAALTVVAACPTATQLLAHYFACKLRAGDCYLLYGSVGAGKSFFSRAFIRAAADNDELPVPSPTFLLQNMYTDHQGPPIHHFDLYRLKEQYDMLRLDLATSFSQAVSLVEWPERLPPYHQPQEHLAVHISILEAGEQQQLVQQLQQAAPAGSRLQTEPGEGEESEEDDDGGDLRWRRICLRPVGQLWESRLELLEQYLQAKGPELGCYMVHAPVTPSSQ